MNLMDSTRSCSVQQASLPQNQMFGHLGFFFMNSSLMVTSLITGIRNAQVLEQVLQGYPMPQPTGCPDKFYDIMLHCLQEQPAIRPTFETVTPVAIKRSLHPTLTSLLCQSI